MLMIFVKSPTIQLFENMKLILQIPFRVYDPMIKDKIMDNQELNFQKFLEESDILF